MLALGAVLQPAVRESLAVISEAQPDPLARWNALTAQLGNHPSFHYGQGYLLFRAGRIDAAEAALARAAESPLAGPADCAIDLFSTALFRYREAHAAIIYNRIITEVATATGTLLVDVHALLADAQQSLAARHSDAGLARTELLSLWFGKESYFVDVVHPSARGHALIAEALAAALADLTVSVSARS